LWLLLLLLWLIRKLRCSPTGQWSRSRFITITDEHFVVDVVVRLPWWCIQCVKIERAEEEEE
jgi:hypothetical protein